MTFDDMLKQEEYLFDDGADSARCVSLFGTGDDVPDSGHIRFPQGCLSLSWGLCEEIKRKAPGVRGFKVQVILTPNASGEVRRNAVTSTGLLADESKGG